MDEGGDGKESDRNELWDESPDEGEMEEEDDDKGDEIIFLDGERNESSWILLSGNKSSLVSIWPWLGVILLSLIEWFFSPWWVPLRMSLIMNDVNPGWLNGVEAIKLISPLDFCSRFFTLSLSLYSHSLRFQSE